MENKEVKFNFKGKDIIVSALVVPKWFEGIGLMFKKKSNAKPLLFKFNKSKQAIHSLFVNFYFYAVWMDEDFKVLEVKKVKPWSFSVNCRREFDYLLEIPIIKDRQFIPSGARRYFGKI